MSNRSMKLLFRHLGSSMNLIRKQEMYQGLLYSVLTRYRSQWSKADKTEINGVGDGREDSGVGLDVVHLMVSMKDEDYFHNLPHNELQELCRKHGLPTYNKSKPHLANMLLSWYQRKSTNSEKLKVTKDVCAADIIVESELHQINKGEVTIRASDMEHRQSSSYSKEIPVSTMNVVLSPRFNSNSAEINRGTSFEAQQVSGGSLFGSKNDDSGSKLKDKGTSDFVKKGDYNQKLVDLTKADRPGNVVPSQCSKKNPCDVPTSSRFIPSHRVDKKMSPSFEFYVRSEEGINLCVDLNSSPLDWIKMLNDGVCIHPDTRDNKPWVLHHEVKSLGR